MTFTIKYNFSISKSIWIIVAILMLFGFIQEPNWFLQLLPPLRPWDEVKSQRTKEGKSKQSERGTERDWMCVVLKLNPRKYPQNLVPQEIPLSDLQGSHSTLGHFPDLQSGPTAPRPPARRPVAPCQPSVLFTKNPKRGQGTSFWSLKGLWGWRGHLRR